LRKDGKPFLNEKNFFPEAAHNYRAYGLLISSEIPIEHFMEENSLENPDVYIRQGEIFGSGYMPPATMQIEVLPGRLLLRGARSATFLVTEGKTITIEPLPGGDPATIQQILLGWAFAGLFHQRAMLPLHGSALCKGDDCFVFCAPSGGGKSTLTSSFLKKGFAFLDDNVALADFQDGTVFIASGSPELRLWKDSMYALDFEHKVIGRIRPDIDKTSIIARSNFRNEKARLTKIFILRRSNDSVVSYVNVRGAAKFRALLENVFCIKFMKDSVCNTGIFHRVHKLAESVPVVDIVLPRKLPSPEALCDAILSSYIMH
jgi:hypothetical protein